jgi:hypothetical protein
MIRCGQGQPLFPPQNILLPRYPLIGKRLFPLPVEAGFGLWWFPADLCSFMPIRAVRSDFIGFALGEPE